MKNLTILSIGALMLSLASCKKAYTCECVTTYDNDKMITKRDISKSSKKDAEAICGNYTEEYSYTQTSPVLVITETHPTTCTLK